MYKNLCESCVYNYGFCDCSVGITKISIDNKGNDIVCACTMYEKDNGQYLEHLKENNK